MFNSVTNPDLLAQIVVELKNKPNVKEIKNTKYNLKCFIVFSPIVQLLMTSVFGHKFITSHNIPKFCPLLHQKDSEGHEKLA